MNEKTLSIITIVILIIGLGVLELQQMQTNEIQKQLFTNQKATLNIIQNQDKELKNFISLKILRNWLQGLNNTEYETYRKLVGGIEENLSCLKQSDIIDISTHDDPQSNPQAVNVYFVNNQSLYADIILNLTECGKGNSKINCSEICPKQTIF